MKKKKKLHLGIGGWSGTLCLGAIDPTRKLMISIRRPRPRGPHVCKRCTAVDQRNRASANRPSGGGR